MAKTSCIEDPSGVEEGKMEGETWRGTEAYGLELGTSEADGG